ncbi:hypothetical protein [Streptomyces sp. NBC_00102]|uniref:hypothetical protein n=1 Tax=Streptomyces sp. NBC_00102 TaxID=2975652 RepID=UPI00225449C5|nr:hypothetical protein [Streptomyces sp. NBC_00102]MCX5398492.1 hypothetical protein [Streptomyces sp. NBC_00102]
MTPKKRVRRNPWEEKRARQAVIDNRETLKREYLVDLVALVTLCRKHRVSPDFLRARFVEWGVPIRGRAAAGDARVTRATRAKARAGLS